jgi:hypothetical protein
MITLNWILKKLGGNETEVSVSLSVSMTGSGRDFNWRIQDWKMRLLKTGAGEMNPLILN